MEIKTGIHSKHRERLLNTLYQTGLESASKIEQLEFILHLCVPVKDTNIISHKLLDMFGSLSKVFDASLEELTQVEGIGINVAKRLKMFPQIFSLYRLDKLGPKISLKKTEKRIEFVKALVENAPVETCYIIGVNNVGIVVDYKKISSGSLRAVGIDMRDVLAFIGAKRCVAIYLVHCHTEGSAIPSARDIEVTEVIENAVSSFGVMLVDHLVVGVDGVYSLKKEGYLEYNELT